MSADPRLAGFADLLRETNGEAHGALVSRAKLIAAQGDFKVFPDLLDRDAWNRETDRRAEVVNELIEEAGYGDLADRLLDDDANARAARGALETHLSGRLGIAPNEASRLFTRALGVSARNVGRTAAELLAEAPETPDYLIPGMVGVGWTVKIAGREKSGKGTLVFYLLGSLERQLETVFGCAYAEPVTALIVTEEPQDALREKIERFRLNRATILYGHELVGMEWAERCRYVAARAADEGHGIVFQDNISRAAGVEDEAGTELARAAETLSDECKAAGLTLIFDHHHKKGGAAIEDKSRGGTALSGMTDNNVESVRSGGVMARFRKITCVGRLSGTIWEKVIVLDDGDRSYTLVSDDEQPQDAAGRARLEKLRDAGEAGVTVPAFAKLIDASDDTARRVLNEWVEEEKATVDRSKRPVRYCHAPVERDGLDY